MEWKEGRKEGLNVFKVLKVLNVFKVLNAPIK
jgi:hypothetical protein